MLTSASGATSNQLCSQSLSFYSRLLLHKQHISCASVRLARMTLRCSEAFSKNHDVCACLLLLKRGPRGTRGRANGRQKAGLWSPAAGDIQPRTKIIKKKIQINKFKTGTGCQPCSSVQPTSIKRSGV